MKTLTLAAALLTMSSLAVEAGWERHSSGVGPYGGTWSSSGAGSCSHGRCSSEQKYTGPRGNTWTRRGSTSCANGICEGTAKYTGPNGKTWERRRSFRRW